MSHIERPASAYVVPKHSCVCCHHCHVSMRQRPRPFRACISCNVILCKSCMTSKWPTNKWEADLCIADDAWVCPRCNDSCTCRPCISRRAKAAGKPDPFAVTSTSSRRRRSGLLDDASDVSGEALTPRKSRRRRAPASSSSSSSAFDAHTLSSSSYDEGAALYNTRPSKQQRKQAASMRPRLRTCMGTDELVASGCGDTVWNSTLTVSARLQGLMERREECVARAHAIDALVVLATAQQEQIESLLRAELATYHARATANEKAKQSLEDVSSEETLVATQQHLREQEQSVLANTMKTATAAAAASSKKENTIAVDKKQKKEAIVDTTTSPPSSLLPKPMPVLAPSPPPGARSPVPLKPMHDDHDDEAVATADADADKALLSQQQLHLDSAAMEPTSPPSPLRFSFASHASAFEPITLAH